jgi:nucleotide-binding universal stress UspA family protein
VAVEIPYGSPIQEIVRRAQEGDHSLIIMGSQGRGLIAEVFLGSVSHNVVRQAPIPVLLVPAVR